VVTNGRAQARLGRALVLVSWASVPAFMLVLFAETYLGPTALRPGYHQPVVHLSAPPALALAIDLLLALPLGWASRLPMTVLGILTAEALGMRLLSADSAWPMFLAAEVLVFYVTATRSRRVSFAAVGIVLAGWAGAYLTSSTGVLVVLRTLPADLLPTLLAAWICGSWIRLRQEHAEALRRQNAAQAVQAERLRIARELHDMVAHSIGVIAIQAGAASLVIDTQPEGAREALRVIERTGRETLAGLRRMLVALRESDDDGATADAAPGLADLALLISSAAEAGIEVRVDWLGEQRELSPEIELSAFRIIQESVTNVVRHAQTDRCRVKVEFQEEELVVEVVDEGRGGTGHQGGAGYGIIGMRERVGLLHGELTAGPRPEGGFRVAARLPA
jgi:signal transduction histidine kinase